MAYLIQPADYKELIILSRESKTYMRKKIATWLPENYNQKMRYGNVAKRQGVTIAGEPCGSFLCEGEILPSWANKKQRWLPCRVNFSTASRIKLNDGLANALSALSEVPPGYGFPMAATSQCSLGNVHMQRVKSVKREAFADNLFQIPKDYKRVENELEVMLGGKLKKQNVDEMMMSR